MIVLATLLAVALVVIPILVVLLIVCYVYNKRSRGNGVAKCTSSSSEVMPSSHGHQHARYVAVDQGPEAIDIGVVQRSISDDHSQVCEYTTAMDDALSFVINKTDIDDDEIMQKLEDLRNLMVKLRRSSKKHLKDNNRIGFDGSEDEDDEVIFEKMFPKVANILEKKKNR